MAGCKKTTTIERQYCQSSLYRRPLIDHNHLHRSSSDGDGAGVSSRLQFRNPSTDDKENSFPQPNSEKTPTNDGRRSILKDSSSGDDTGARLRIQDSVDSEKGYVWDFSDSESAPASSWSALPNRALLYRPLPLDVGRCTCIILKESSPDGFNGGVLYTLYTYDGKGRQNRKLAVAHHIRRRGRSEFTVAQTVKGIIASSEESLIGIVTSNIVGSKYRVWDQVKKGYCHRHSKNKEIPKLLAAVNFTPTVSTWTGKYRSMKAWIPIHQSMPLKNTYQIQHINGLPNEWEENKDKTHKLYSKIPSYNKFARQYELEYRDRGVASMKILSSVKNFQLTMERNGKQAILQLGKLGKSKYVMDYRYPLSGYQAFCICLASIDSKLCCSV